MHPLINYILYYCANYISPAPETYIKLVKGEIKVNRIKISPTFCPHPRGTSWAAVWMATALALGKLSEAAQEARGAQAKRENTGLRVA